MFTRQTLRALANGNSYRRGEALYDDNAVEKLRREPDGFAAVVRGSRAYRVGLRLAAAGPAFSCSCPYDLDGICKHAVAAGLAVLDAYRPDELAPAPPETPAPLAEAALGAAVKAAWADRKKADRLRFLKQALAKNPDLARQFLAFGQPVAAPPAASATRLADLPERLHEALADLDFGEDLWEEAGEKYGYDDEGDGLQELANELLTEALAPFVAELLRLARGGQLALALRYWAAACAGIFQVEEPQSDEYGVFGDYGQDVLAQWHTDLQAAGWPQVLLAAVVPPAELRAALAWLGQHLADPPARWPDFDASWLPLLLALAADASAAPLLPPALAQAALAPATLAHLRLRLAQTLADDAAWLAAAETLLPTDAAVARQLLHFYTSKGDRKAALRTATAAFATWPDQFGDHALRTYTAATAPTLYREALRYRALANSSLPDYEALRPLLSEGETTSFVQRAVADAQARRGSIAFAAELLAGRADTAALRDFVLGLEWLFATPAPQLDRALTLLAAADPTPLMLELETRSRAYLTGRAGAKRGHALYGSLARWLALVRSAAPRLSEPALRLAQELREEFPTLHGLKEALRDAGLLAPPAPGAKKGKK